MADGLHQNWRATIRSTGNRPGPEVVANHQTKLLVLHGCPEDWRGRPTSTWRPPVGTAGHHLKIPGPPALELGILCVPTTFMRRRVA